MKAEKKIKKKRGTPGSSPAKTYKGRAGARRYYPADRARQETRNKLASLEVSPSKQRGQNFLVSELVISSIIEFGKPGREEFLVEIGPGLGALTTALSAYGLKAAIEIESAFAGEIRSKYPDLQVYEADARDFDFSVFKTPISIFSNLPYSISSEMILSLVKSGSGAVKRIVLMLQKEFVQRLVAPVGGSDYGILSVYCQRAAKLRSGPIISAEYFHPRPKIDSQLIEICFKTESTQRDSKFEELFTRLVRAAFSKRRKTLLNSLLSSGLASKAIWEQCLEQAHLLPSRRAQELSWEDFERLTENYSSINRSAA